MPESSDANGAKSIWDRIGRPVIISVAASLIVAGVLAVITYLTKPPEPVRLNYVLVLDTSQAMVQEFGETTRFEAAVAELIRFVEPRDADNLTLWAAGGSCGPGGTEILVPFGQHNSARIRAALGELEPQGPADLGDAVVMATSAFNDPDQFPADVEKFVFVFTTGKDTCGGDYVGRIEERLGEVGEDFTVEFRFFALKVSSRVKRDLRGLKRELPDQVEIAFSDTPSDLNQDVLEAAAVIEPTPMPTPAPTDLSETGGPVPGP
jgi:hypothetical protein